MCLPEARGVLPKRFCGKRGSEIHEKGENLMLACHGSPMSDKLVPPSAAGWQSEETIRTSQTQRGAKVS